MELQKQIEWLKMQSVEKNRQIKAFEDGEELANNREYEKHMVNYLSNELDLILSIIKLCKEKQKEEVNYASSINYKKETLIPSLKMVKDHFKNAEKVKPLNSDNIYTIEEDVTSRGFHFFSIRLLG